MQRGEEEEDEEEKKDFIFIFIFYFFENSWPFIRGFHAMESAFVPRILGP